MLPVTFAWYNEDGDKILQKGENNFFKREGIGGGGEGSLLTLTIICNIIFDLYLRLPERQREMVQV